MVVNWSMDISIGEFEGSFHPVHTSVTSQPKKLFQPSGLSALPYVLGLLVAAKDKVWKICLCKVSLIYKDKSIVAIILA